MKTYKKQARATLFPSCGGCIFVRTGILFFILATSQNKETNGSNYGTLYGLQSCFV